MLGLGPPTHPCASSSLQETLDTTIDGKPCPKLDCYINTFPDASGESIYTSPAVNPQNCSDDESGEGRLATHATSVIKTIAAKRKAGDDRPFFLATGFHRPHIPWHAPQHYYDMYEKDMPLAPHPAPPQTSESQQDSMSLNNNWVGEKFNYSWNGQTHAIGQGYWTGHFADLAAVPISPYMPRDGTGPPKEAQQLVRQAYRAAISFTDRNIGQVLDAAKANGLYENTIVVLWADHGYQLGDNGQWGKHTDFEHATRIPFARRPRIERATFIALPTPCISEGPAFAPRSCPR